jgi:hypothetical protein
VEKTGRGERSKEGRKEGLEGLEEEIWN